MPMPKNKRLVCPECQGGDVTVEALVFWSEENQQYECTDAVYEDHGYCDACDQEIEPEFVDV